MQGREPPAKLFAARLSIFAKFRRSGSPGGEIREPRSRRRVDRNGHEHTKHSLKRQTQSLR